MMIVGYAKFSKRHPYFHIFLISSLTLIFLISAFILIEYETIELAGVIILIGSTLPFFAKASKYKQQYLSD
ncbi:hypothetical protein P0Y67_17705 [Photobacterium sp. SP02]|uniref:hypothetical protein n=1 Tax=Photobacterium sp. SP02 TaxID=3032280 RepID=UPI003144D5CF